MRTTDRGLHGMIFPMAQGSVTWKTGQGWAGLACEGYGKLPLLTLPSSEPPSLQEGPEHCRVVQGRCLMVWHWACLLCSQVLHSKSPPLCPSGKWPFTAGAARHAQGDHGVPLLTIDNFTKHQLLQMIKITVRSLCCPVGAQIET